MNSNKSYVHQHSPRWKPSLLSFRQWWWRLAFDTYRLLVALSSVPAVTRGQRMSSWGVRRRRRCHGGDVDVVNVPPTARPHYPSRHGSAVAAVGGPMGRLLLSSCRRRAGCICRLWPPRHFVVFRPSDTYERRARRSFDAVPSGVAVGDTCADGGLRRVDGDRCRRDAKGVIMEKRATDRVGRTRETDGQQDGHGGGTLTTTSRSFVAWASACVRCTLCVTMICYGGEGKRKKKTIRAVDLFFFFVVFHLTPILIATDYRYRACTRQRRCRRGGNNYYLRIPNLTEMQRGCATAVCSSAAAAAAATVFYYTCQRTPRAAPPPAETRNVII